MPLLLREMSEHESKPLEIDVVGLSGFTLQRHWELGAAAQKIKSGKFDYVILQDLSTGPLADRESFFKHARLLDEQIRLRGAKTLFFLTWARKYAPEMQAGLTGAYTTIAK